MRDYHGRWTGRRVRIIGTRPRGQTDPMGGVSLPDRIQTDGLATHLDGQNKRIPHLVISFTRDVAIYNVSGLCRKILT